MEAPILYATWRISCSAGDRPIGGVIYLTSTTFLLFEAIPGTYQRLPIGVKEEGSPKVQRLGSRRAAAHVEGEVRAGIQMRLGWLCAHIAALFFA